jgi:hypothetical protein
MEQKIYRALLNQGGSGAPVATIITNTLGVTPVFVRGKAGVYGMTVTGNILVRNKLIIRIKHVCFSYTYPEFGVLLGFTSHYWNDMNNITILTTDSAFVLADEILNDTEIEIEIIP